MKVKYKIVLITLIVTLTCILSNVTYAVGSTLQAWKVNPTTGEPFILFRTSVVLTEGSVNNLTYRAQFEENLMPQCDDSGTYCTATIDCGGKNCTYNLYTDYKAVDDSSGKYTYRKTGWMGLCDDNGKNCINVALGTHNSKWVKPTTVEQYNKKLASNSTLVSKYNLKSIGLIFHDAPITTYTKSSYWADNIGYSKLITASDMKTLYDSLNSSEHVLGLKLGLTGTGYNSIFHTINTFNGTFGTIGSKDANGNKINSSTGLSWTITTGTNKALKTTEYRHAIISVDGNEDVGEWTGIEITDSIIQGEDLEAIREHLKEKNKNSSYVSTIYASGSFIPGVQYEAAKSAYSFYKKRAEDGSATTPYWWSYSVRGIWDKGLGSALNNYDNLIYFPQFSNRTVLVRHINVGDNTQISQDIVSKGTRIPSNNLKLQTSASVLTGTTSPKTTYKTTYQEYFEAIDGELSISKTALNDTNTYKFLASNYTVANDENTALLVINNNIIDYKYGYNKTVNIAANSSTANDDVVVIDFYYTTHDKDVYVNHLFVDKNGAILDNQEYYQNKFGIDKLSYKYSKVLGTDILTSRISSLDEHYIGYEYVTASGVTHADMPHLFTDKQVKIDSSFSGDEVRINYYYYVNNEEYTSEPNKNIAGKVFMEANSKNEQTVCLDGSESVMTTTVPAGSNVNVGFTGIPSAMVGAINSNYIAPTKQTATVTLKFNDRQVAINNISYKVGYYNITDMVIYKIANATIYDDKSSKIFDWTNGELKLNSSTNLDVKLYNINGNEISKSDIYRPTNYVQTTITDKYNNQVIGNGKTITYDFSTSQIAGLSDAINSNNYTKIAEILGLKLNVKVQNLIVKINDKQIATSEVSTGSIDLSKSTDNFIVAAKKPKYDLSIYNGVSYIKLEEEEKLKSNILNGIRTLTANAQYEAQVVIGNKAYDSVIDTVYNSSKSTEEKTVVFTLKDKTLSKDFVIDNSTTKVEDKYNEVIRVNIYTPITVTAEFKSQNSSVVNQTTGTNLDKTTVQVNTPFTITLDNNSKDNIYANMENTKAYNNSYYIKFEFDVHKVKINGQTYNKDNLVEAGTWIGPITRTVQDKAYITAQAHGGSDNVISEEKSGYTVMAFASNATSSIKNQILNNKSPEEIKNICNINSYYATITQDVAIINRMYDFRITDLKDLSWKNVFRTNTQTATSKHSGLVYYGGVTKWNPDSQSVNSIVSRASSEIGRNPLRILPLGPYKNTDITYIKAPKMGYRFSFDMKVTGNYSTNKYVNILTKFYYVSKDGKTFLEEHENGKEGIYLFYKNSSGKYVRIDSNGGGYGLTFTPNDGYRYITDSNTSTLATKAVSLGNLRNITLKSNMATYSNGVTTYYGEYKLPNSTIAVKVDKDGKYNINQPLTNGYIGVVFEIKAYTGTINLNNVAQNVWLSYSKDTLGDNTSQWDYEGFLGYTGYGKKVVNNTLSLKLENGKWNIDNNTYNKIKGSVVLYDIDQRAATDYE